MSSHRLRKPLLQSKMLLAVNCIVLGALAAILSGGLAFQQSSNHSFQIASIESSLGGVAWVPDNGDGTYTNPVIFADYSDPDVIRVGDDFYMTSSSFSHFPGLPILHSKDLVNWKIIGHAVPRYPMRSFDVPQHGKGIWAPSIRYHWGEYYIYFGDPDNGIFMTKAKNPAGPWDSLVLIREAKGWIDPCPLWDEDGNVYLVHAWANSRSGIKSVLTMNRMNAQGTKILDEGTMIFDGTLHQPTIEGPKLYKRNRYYYIFAPAGGVKTGWQTVLRSRNVYGPYEEKIVLHQGNTDINGPHQGAWVQTQRGESWFVHFQDCDSYGRLVLLEPMLWTNDWPQIGEDHGTNGIGEPVGKHRKPHVGRSCAIEVPQTGDEFESSSLGLQWQWESNPQRDWYSLEARTNWLRLHCRMVPDSSKNLWDIGNVVAQKIPAPDCTVTTKLDVKRLPNGGRSGMIVYGLDYSYVAIEKLQDTLKLIQSVCTDADKGGMEHVLSSREIHDNVICLRLILRKGAICSFSYAVHGENFSLIGKDFSAKPGKWVGAKIGLFAEALGDQGPVGYVDFDWIRFGRKR
jgi:beta-xylosidase